MALKTNNKLQGSGKKDKNSSCITHMFELVLVVPQVKGAYNYTEETETETLEK